MSTIISQGLNSINLITQGYGSSNIISLTGSGTSIISGIAIVNINGHFIYNITGSGIANILGASVIKNIYNIVATGKSTVAGTSVTTGGSNFIYVTGSGITNISGLAKIIIYPHKTFQYTPKWNCNITGNLVPVIPLSVGSIIKQKLFLHDRNSLAIIPAITVCNQKIVDYV